jgi:TonB family protein
MAYRLAVALVVAALVLTAAAQETSDCPAHSEINNGICRDKDGADCSKEHQPTICYDTEPQYTDEAAKANIKGTVELWATVRTDGCAYDIKVTTTLGYGLDEAAISALERFRFSRPLKAVHVEFNFDPKFSSRTPLTAPPCVKLAHQRSDPK